MYQSVHLRRFLQNNPHGSWFTSWRKRIQPVKAQNLPKPHTTDSSSGKIYKEGIKGEEIDIDLTFFPDIFFYCPSLSLTLFAILGSPVNQKGENRERRGTKASKEHRTTPLQYSTPLSSPPRSSHGGLAPPPPSPRVLCQPPPTQAPPAAPTRWSRCPRRMGGHPALGAGRDRALPEVP